MHFKLFIRFVKIQTNFVYVSKEYSLSKVDNLIFMRLPIELAEHCPIEVSSVESRNCESSESESVFWLGLLLSSYSYKAVFVEGTYKILFLIIRGNLPFAVMTSLFWNCCQSIFAFCFASTALMLPDLLICFY